MILECDSLRRLLQIIEVFEGRANPNLSVASVLQFHAFQPVENLDHSQPLALQTSKGFSVQSVYLWNPATSCRWEFLARKQTSGREIKLPGWLIGLSAHSVEKDRRLIDLILR